MDLSLRKMACVVALADLRSFARAAEQVGVSQPALSRTIGLLEAEYRVRLFDRGRGGVSPTRAGAALVADARRLLAEARLADHNLRAIGAGDAGEVHLGMGPLPAALLLKRALADTIRTRPGVRVDCAIDAAERLLAGLHDGRLDFCVFSESFLPPGPAYSVTDLGPTALGLFVRSGHPLAGAPIVTVADIARFPMVSGHLGSPDTVGKLFGRFTPTVFCDDFALLRELMLDTDAIFVGSHLQIGEELARGEACELAPGADGWAPPPTRLVLVRIAGRTLGPAGWEMIERIAALCRA